MHQGVCMLILTVGSTIKDDKNNIYFLEEIIGQGGFGYVFRARRTNDDTLFAVKTTFPSFSNESSLTAFKNEIQSASKVSGKNVIHYEYVHDGDAFPDYPPYIIMEYADGGTLHSVLKKRKQSKNRYSNYELTQIFKQLVQGMKQINKTLVHRDIKPDNILLCGNVLKISDFGLAKVAAESTRTMSFKGAGTPLYMAPEAWDLSKNTIQMDIYSMGVVFYELATLQYPYSPMPQSYEECKSMHLYSPFQNPQKANPALSPSIASLICRMLEKPSKRRFSNWDEILGLLDVQSVSSSPLDELVMSSVAAKNAEDMLRQERESAEMRERKEKEEFLRLINAQFTQTIIAPIIEFAERINAQYAGKEKLTFPANQYTAPHQTTFFWKLNIPPNRSITINFEAIFKENFTREVNVNGYYSRNHMRTECYIPKYKGKNILGWGEIVNNSGYGFNILLLDGGDIYGDWIIMNNKNNFSSMANKVRREPFAFSLKELVSEIDRVQITHLYSAEFNAFSEQEFLALIQALAFRYI